MRPFLIAALLLTIQDVHATGTSTEALLPIGAIRKDSEVTLQAVDNSVRYVSPQYGEKNKFLESITSENLYQVTQINSADKSSDTADLQALATSSRLVIQQAQLAAASSNCSLMGLNTQCTLTSDLAAYKTSQFNMVNWFMNLFGEEPKNQAAPIALAAEVSQPLEAEAMTQALTAKIERTNRNINTKSVIANCEESQFPEDLRRKEQSCGVKLALEAYKKNKSRIKKDVIIFNDFSGGGIMGKMWFLNPDGTPAQVVEKNPLQVSRGEGGFGSGRGSLKTPNGAVLTQAYRPPRNGNIKDGIELIGLEPENKDIYARGILLHGWDPYMPTQGCLGVAGMLDTRASGHRPLGGPPPYLDQLKKGLLKDGGVMIYNFTPAKVKLCQSNN